MTHREQQLLSFIESDVSSARPTGRSGGAAAPEPVPVSALSGACHSREPYKLLDLFSGIGGFSLGLERTGGFETVAFCEIEDFPRRVLAKHWPEVPCYHDIRELTAARLTADGIAVDAICGGFPCQDISLAGAGEGLDGARSGLWFEYARLIGELRPRYVIVENVAALLGRGLAAVLGSLSALRYDAEWHCIPAAAVGAPHRRDRLWLVAYPDDGRVQVGWGHAEVGEGADGSRRIQSDDASCRQQQAAALVADAYNAGRLKQRWPLAIRAELVAVERGGGWCAEPDVGRVAHGVPNRVDRLHALGNAVVPQIPELIGHAILSAERAAA